MGLLTRCIREYLNLDLLPIRLALFFLAWLLNGRLWSSAVDVAAAAADKGSATLEEGAGLLTAAASYAASCTYTYASLAALTTASAASRWRVRWQLYPAFTSVVLACTGHHALTQLLLRRATAVLGMVLATVSAALDAALPVVALPTPRGPYTVGRTSRYWVDPSREPWLNEAHDIPTGPGRQLYVDIWYPCTSDSAVLEQHDKSPFVSKAIVGAICKAFGVPQWLMGHMCVSRTHAFSDAPPMHATEAGEAHGCPVVLFAHSLGGLKMQNTALMEELASFGYVCVACDFPYDATLVVYPDEEKAEFLFMEIPDNLTPTQLLDYRHKCIQVRTDDLHFMRRKLFEVAADAADPLAHVMDASRVSVLGHSYGGGTVVNMAQQDLSVACVMMLDGCTWPNHRDRCGMGVAAPLLSLRSPVFLGDRDCYCAVNVQLTDLLCRRTAHSVSAVVDVGHYDYTDMIWISPTLFRCMGVMGVTAAQRIHLHNFIADSCLGFLAAHCASAAGSSVVAPTTCPTLPLEWEQHYEADAHVDPEWTPSQDAYLRSMVQCVMEGGTQWASTSHGGWQTMLTFPPNGDFATEAQVLLCSHSVSSVRRRAEELGYRRDVGVAAAAAAAAGMGKAPTAVSTVRRTDSAHMQLEKMGATGAAQLGQRSRRQGHARTDSAQMALEVAGASRRLVASDSCSSIAFAGSGGGGGMRTPRQLSPDLCSKLRPRAPSPPLTRRRARELRGLS